MGFGNSGHSDQLGRRQFEAGYEMNRNPNRQTQLAIPSGTFIVGNIGASTTSVN